MTDDLNVASLQNEFPGWHVWEGVSGDLFYARRPRSSPPIVKRAQTLEELRDEIAKHVDGTRPACG